MGLVTDLCLLAYTKPMRCLDLQDEFTARLEKISQSKHPDVLRLFDAAGAGASLTREVRDHLDRCEDCLQLFEMFKRQVRNVPNAKSVDRRMG